MGDLEAEGVAGHPWGSTQGSGGAQPAGEHQQGPPGVPRASSASSPCQHFCIFNLPLLLHQASCLPAPSLPRPTASCCLRDPSPSISVPPLPGGGCDHRNICVGDVGVRLGEAGSGAVCGGSRPGSWCRQAQQELVSVPSQLDGPGEVLSLPRIPGPRKPIPWPRAGV